jgi:uncharacterized protein
MAQEHSFATPSPAGLGALAVATFGFAPVFLGWVDTSCLPLLSAWLIGGFICQLVVAVMELKDHNITGGNVFLFFCSFFMLAAAISVFAKWYMISFMFTPKAVKAAIDTAAGGLGIRPEMLSPEQVKAAMAGVGPAIGAMMQKTVYIEGWMWMAGAIFITVLTPAYAKSSSLFFFAVILVDIVLWLIVGADTGWFSIGGIKLTKSIIGYLMIVIGMIGLYFSGATVCNTVYGKALFPLPKPLIK